MRGDGSIHQRHAAKCSNKGRPRAEHAACACAWEIAFYFRGKLTREHGGRSEREAKKKLRERIKSIHGDRYAGPDEGRLTVADLLDTLERNLESRGRSVRSFRPHIKAMRKHFGMIRAIDMTPMAIERYQQEELNAFAPRAHATINREVGCLRAAFRLAHKRGQLSRLPYFLMLPEDNARQGFVEPATFEKIASNLPTDLSDAARFAYLTGWRRGQIGKLRWEHVDWTNKLIAVPGALTKNGQPQTVPLFGKLLELVERRRARREVVRKGQPVFLSQFVFHRGDGRQLGDFRKAWAKSCTAAGIPGVLFHDLRRSAARNLVRAGVDRDVARKITGHRTESMFSRYNITDTADQLEAFRRVDGYVDEQCEKADKVASIGART